MSLDEEKIEHAKAGEPPLSPEEARVLHEQLPNWTLADNALKHDYTFKDFGEAIAFVNRVADIAQSVDHHPDIYISYNKVNLTLSTHKIGGLSRNDFILAAKIDKVTSG